MAVDALLVLCTCPDSASAAAVATALLEEKLAACVNRVPGIRSVYRWQDHVEKDDEVLLLIKTRPALYADVERTILQLHPYEVPEVIGLPVSVGSEAYLKWIGDVTT